MTTVQGVDALQRRLKAVGEPKPLLRALQLAVISEAQKLVPRKTGNLQRSIVPGEITDTSARVVVNAKYGLYVEKGTGVHGPKKRRIEPGKVMHWQGGGKAKVRLSGRSRVRRGQSLGDDVFATSTQGAKAQPFLEPGAKKAVEASGVADIIIEQWNGAA